MQVNNPAMRPDGANVSMSTPQKAAFRTAIGADLLSNELFTASGTGAVTRDAQEKARERLSIWDFIPVAEVAAIVAKTSTYDCSSDFADAILAAQTQKKDLHIGGGRFRCLSDIVVNIVANVGGIDITGEGQNYSEIEFFGSGATNGLWINGTSGFQYAGAIRNLTVNGSNTNPAGIKLTYLNRPVLDKVIIRAVAGTGLLVDNVIMPTINDSLILGCGTPSKYGAEFNVGTCAVLRQVYIAGGEAPGGTSLRAGGLSVNRWANFNMLGGAIESTNTPITICNQTEGSSYCVAGTFIGVDLENPGNNRPYIDIGAGWTGAAGFGVRSYSFIACHGTPSGTTLVPYGVNVTNTDAARFENCYFSVAGAVVCNWNFPGTNYATVVTGNRGFFGSSYPWIMENGVHNKFATPYVDYSRLQNPNYLNSVRTITSGTTFSASIFAVQGGLYKNFYLNYASPTNVTNITDGDYTAQIILTTSNANITLVHGAGGAGQILFKSGVNLSLAAGDSITLYWSNYANCWHDML